HFQSARAETTFVMGEFPWQVRVGDTAMCEDYVAPPQILSAEVVPGETAWSSGEYITGGHVWQAFQLPGSPPPVQGVYANQPSPVSAKVRSAWMTCLSLMVALFALMLLASLFMRQEEVFRQKYSFATGSGEPSFVTPEFDLKGRPSNVEISISSDLDNDWAFFRLALINTSTGQAFDLGREVSYYRGRDSDGDWAEGGRNDSVVLPTIPGGRYYLRVEPEMDQARPMYRLNRTMNYEIAVRRDVPVNLFFGLAAGLLLIPPVIVTIRRAKFESQRWAESDYSGGDSSGGNDDDDDEDDDE
ncbi:MAG: hypothetical protein ACRD44_03910, partial [Bryobacteraceae bacterium]